MNQAAPPPTATGRMGLPSTSILVMEPGARFTPWLPRPLNAARPQPSPAATRATERLAPTTLVASRRRPRRMMRSTSGGGAETSDPAWRSLSIRSVDSIGDLLDGDPLAEPGQCLGGQGAHGPRF